MKIFTEKSSKYLIGFGIILLFSGLILFLWRDSNFDLDLPIDKQKFGQFSDYFGGIIGSIWGLAGVILFYVALTDQREDIKTNRQVLTTQVKALEQQIEEFKLQRDEMRMTREVFDEQSVTLKKQQFESTFFNSLNLFNEILKEISFIKTENPDMFRFHLKGSRPEPKIEIYKGRESFKQIYEELRKIYSDVHYEYLQEKLFQEDAPENSISLEISNNDELEILNRSYKRLFDLYQSQLGHYFRTIYNIIERIHIENLENPKYYTNLFRAQISTYEHLLLFYNGISDYGKENLKPLIDEFQFLDNLRIELLIDESHKKFYNSKAYV